VILVIDQQAMCRQHHLQAQGELAAVKGREAALLADAEAARERAGALEGAAGAVVRGGAGTGARAFSLSGTVREFSRLLNVLAAADARRPADTAALDPRRKPCPPRSAPRPRPCARRLAARAHTSRRVPAWRRRQRQERRLRRVEGVGPLLRGPAHARGLPRRPRALATPGPPLPRRAVARGPPPLQRAVQVGGAAPAPLGGPPPCCSTPPPLPRASPAARIIATLMPPSFVCVERSNGKPTALHRSGQSTASVTSWAKT
jgi:hypothetical protein